MQERDTAGQALAAQAAAMHDALSAAEAEIARLQRLSKSSGAEASTLQVRRHTRSMATRNSIMIQGSSQEGIQEAITQFISVTQEQLAAAQAEAAQVRGEAEAATRRLRAAQATAAEAEDHAQHLQQELSYVKQRFAPAAHLCDTQIPPATPSRASAPAASMSHSGAAGMMWWPHSQGQVTQSLPAGATRACPQLPSWCRAEKAASKGQGLEAADTGIRLNSASHPPMICRRADEAASEGWGLDGAAGAAQG